MTDSRQFILDHLQREPYLTAKQLAILRRPSEKACLTSKINPPNLAGSIRILKRMAEDKELKVKAISPTDPEYYCLPKIRALSRFNHLHERLCADLYVAFDITGKLQYWEKPEDYDEYVELGLKPDRAMILDGVLCFWEVDRGGEPYKVIQAKVEKYIQLSRLHPDKRFHVIFTTIDDKQTAKSRCAAILDLLAEYKRGDQFLTTPHKWAVEEPLNPVFLSPLNPMAISLMR